MNHYTDYLKNYYTRLLTLRHYAFRIDKILTDSITTIVNLENIDDDFLLHGSRLAISDWTSNPSEIFSTGIRVRTLKNDYEQEIQTIISQEFGFAFAQSFEALETFMKDCIFNKISRNEDFKNSLKPKDPMNLQRNNMPDGDNLFIWVKKACGKYFNEYSNKNNKVLNFTDFWKLIALVRHAITHSSSMIKKEKIEVKKWQIFNSIFDHEEINPETIKIKLNRSTFNLASDQLAEFGFQIFKMLSLEENMEWQDFRSNFSKTSVK